MKNPDGRLWRTRIKDSSLIGEKKMIKAVVSGACGRMGAGIIERALEDGNIELSGALEADGHPRLGNEVHGVRVVSDIRDVAEWDVLVEFATPEAALSHLPAAAAAGKRAVVGATGFSAGQLESMRAFSKDMALLISPNMSIGVNILLKIAAEAARALGEDFDMEIVEAHHNRKKDAPSGTAARIADVIAAARGVSLEEKGVYGRRGLKERVPGEIGIHAVRGGTVTGEHTVLFAGDSERLEITHRAENRDIFVLGTIRAVKFIAKAPPGLYSMEDVIGQG